MTSPRPKKSGFMANLQASMAPAVQADDGRPVVRPRSITVAGVLVMLAGLLFLLIGTLSVSSTRSQAATYQTFYNDAVAECQDNVGGIGTAVPSTVATPTSASGPLSATALPSSCRQITSPTLSESTLSSYKSTLVIFSVILLFVGLATAASGWFLREGRKWSRRVLIGVVVVQLALAFLFQVSNTVTLLATLLIVVGLSITFIGRAGAYFMAVALRKQQH